LDGLPPGNGMSTTEHDGCARFEAPMWALIAALCLAAAIWQWVELADRVHHVLWFAVKFDFAPHLISARIFMVIVFFAGTALFASLGIVATIQLRRAELRYRFCSLLGVLMLVTGALVWGGLLASPLIQIVSRG
jgi:hypothetical protein